MTNEQREDLRMEERDAERIAALEEAREAMEADAEAMEALAELLREVRK